MAIVRLLPERDRKYPNGEGADHHRGFVLAAEQRAEARRLRQYPLDVADVLLKWVDVNVTAREKN